MRITVGMIAATILACGPGARRGGDGNGSGSGNNGGGADAAGPEPIAMTCEQAQQNQASVGCDYYGVDMDAAQGPPNDACYAVFVANVSSSAVHVQAAWNGQAIDLSKYAKLPSGQGM